MKFTVKGHRTDFPEDAVKGVDRQTFVTKWAKKVWQHISEEQRYAELCNVWDIINKGLNTAGHNEWHSGADEKPAPEPPTFPADRVETGGIFPKTRKRVKPSQNGLQGHTEEAESLEP